MPRQRQPRPASALHAPRPPGALALLVAVALVVPATILLVADEAQAATTRTLAITSATAHPTVPFSGFDGQGMRAFDIDGDGDKEIIAQNDNQWVYVFDSRTGAILAELKTVFPAGWGARSFNAPEVAILNGDGKVHLILANSAATITSYTYDPVGSSGVHLAFKKDWERRLTDCHSNPGMDSKPVLADLDKDGRLEILAATEELGIYALRDNGAVMWKSCTGGGNGEPTVGDLNLDGWPDVVFGSDAGLVTAFNGRTGGTMWSFWTLGRFALGSASIPVGVAIGQLDGVGGPDVVFGARDSHDATVIDNNHALLAALDSNGRLLWGKQDPAANPLTYTHPVIVDADRDGENEVYWGDWNTMGHKPGNWETTGQANFYRFDRWGNVVWRQGLDTYWSNKDVPIADVDGDGVQEMLANGPSNGQDGIWYLNTNTGAKEAFVSVHPWKVMRAPLVADLHGDGRMDWVVQVAAATSAAGGPGILVYDAGVPYSAAWPGLPSPARGTGTGTISTTTTSTGTTGPGGFTASFNVPSSVNEWWVEVAVTANQGVASVCAQVNGGACTALAKQSWGSWAKSFHVPAGSQVVFKATSTGGAVASSQPVSWLGASGGAFTANFTPKAVGNDWWVEVDVGANQALQRVEAKVNGGAWTPLTKQSWGSWAKSLNAPNGSTVTFRAVSTSGAMVTSQTYAWP